MDNQTTIQDLKDLLIKFRDDRDWKKFHNPKDIALAISVEVGELQELFLWQDKEKVEDKIKNNPKFRKEVGEELADIIIFCINFANTIDIDVSEVIKSKVEKNNEKYSVEKAKGKYTKYNKL